jgi:predicted nucleic acid-binding protein
MMRVLLDTNVVLSFVSDRSRAQQEKAAQLLERGVEGTVRLSLHQTVAAELVYVLLNVYRRPAAEVAALLSDLIGMPGLTPIDVMPWSSVLALWPRTLPDFSDAVLAAVAKEGRFNAVATFDRTFARRLGRLGMSEYWTAKLDEAAGE